MDKKSKKKHLTDITLIVDRSGSMCSCAEEATNGINYFINTQKKEKGKGTFTLVQFDTQYEFVYKGVDIKTVEKYTLIPRGLTALLDAVGKSINEAKERIDKSEKKPDLVIFCIVTDGQENSSHEFKRETIKKLIQEQQNKGWQFTFLGANIDAFAEGGSMGVAMAATAQYTNKTAKSAFKNASKNVSRMRMSSYTGQSVQNFYTDDERDDMGG